MHSANFTPIQLPAEEEIGNTTTDHPGLSTPAYEPNNLFMPNYFVNSAEEGEINNSTELEIDEGKINSEIKTEEIQEPHKYRKYRN